MMSFFVVVSVEVTIATISCIESGFLCTYLIVHDIILSSFCIPG